MKVLHFVFAGLLVMIALGPVAQSGAAEPVTTSLEQSFQKARHDFVQKDMPAAAQEIRKGVTYLKAEAAAAAGKGKTALTASSRELEKLAGDLEKGTVHYVKQIDMAFARAHRSLAENAHLKAAEAWTRGEIKNTAGYLETAAVSLKRAFAWAGQKGRADAQTAVAEATELSQKLKKGAGWTADEVSKGLTNLGARIQEFGQSPAER